MGQMQHLGRIEEEGESKLGQLAQALTTIMGGVEKGREKGIAREEKVYERGINERAFGLEEQKIGMQEQKLQVDLKNVEYEKKKATADMVTKVAKSLDSEAAEEFIHQPQVKSLFDDLGWPLPTGLHEEKETKDLAVEAVGIGEALPGMTMDETKKLAGVYIPEQAITRDVIKSAPWSPADIIPWAESEREKLERLRRERAVGGSRGRTVSTTGGKGNDPLGVRK